MASLDKKTGGSSWSARLFSQFIHFADELRLMGAMPGRAPPSLTSSPGKDQVLPQAKKSVGEPVDWLAIDHQRSDPPT